MEPGASSQQAGWRTTSPTVRGVYTSNLCTALSPALTHTHRYITPHHDTILYRRYFGLLQIKMSSPTKQYASESDLFSAQEHSGNITQRKRKQPDCELLDAIKSMQSDFNKAIQDLRVDLGTKIDTLNTGMDTVRNDLESYQSAMQKEMEHLRLEQTKIKKDITDLSTEVRGLEASNKFISDQHDELAKKVAQCSKHSMNVTKYEGSVTSLELKIDALEQQARQCNLEIQNLPEKRNENLINLVVTLGDKIQCNIDRNDIIGVNRVRHATESGRPKHIVVKLISRVLRDNVLAACRAKRGLTSTELGISGAEHTVYVNEHLTLRRKKLFRAAREAAKQAHYKYKWVSNATILVRATDTSPIIAIHTEKDLEKIQKQKVADSPSSSRGNVPGVSE